MGLAGSGFIAYKDDEMARPRSSTLTPAHLRVARALWAAEKGGFPALVSELVGALGLAGRTSLVPTLRIMQRNGFLTLRSGGPGRDALVRLTPRGRLAVGGGGLPVWGSIRAGVLEEARAEPEAVWEEAAELLPHQPGDFLLKVEGDSMVGDGILEGDYVLLRPGVAVERGEIAAVQVGAESGEGAGGCEATLKRVYPEGALLRLRAANPHYEDQLVPAAAVRVAGVYRGLLRHVAPGR